MNKFQINPSNVSEAIILKNGKKRYDFGYIKACPLALADNLRLGTAIFREEIGKKSGR
jgi:hypothetical protein